MAQKAFANGTFAMAVKDQGIAGRRCALSLPEVAAQARLTALLG